MGVTVATLRQAINTSTGTQDFTTSKLGGLTPKAARMWMTRATADGTATDGMSLGYGIVSGASNRSYNAIADDHGLTTSASFSAAGTDRCIYLVDGTGTILAEADFSAWITNGITLNWVTTTPAAAYLLHIEFFAGTDLSAYAGTVNLQNTVDTVIDVTDPGFRPDVVFALSDGLGGTTTSHMLSFGLVHEDGVGTVTQRAALWGAQNARTTTRNNALIRDDCGIVDTGFNLTTVDFRGVFGSFDSSGFSVTTVDDGGNNNNLNYLALSFGGAVSSAVVTYSTPISIGSASFSGLSFKPQYVSIIGSMLETINSGDNTGLSGARMIAACDATNQYAASFNAEDNVTTTNTQSLSDDVPVQLPDDNGAAGLTASFTSFNSDGWTLNYSAVEANAKLLFVLSIEEEAAGGATVNLNTLTLASSAQALSVTPGAVTTGLNTLSLASSAVSLSVATTVSVALNSLTLTSSAVSLSVVPGAASVSLNSLSLASSAVSLSVTPGAISVSLSSLSLASSAESLTVTAGAVSVLLNTLSLAGSAVTLSVSPGDVTITLNDLTLASSAVSLSVLAGTIVGLNSLSLTSSAVSLSVVPGTVSVSLSALTLASSAETLSILTGVLVALNSLTLTSSAVSLSVSPGAIAASLNTLTLVSSAETLSVVPGAITASLNTLSLTSSVETLTVSLETLVLLNTLSLVSSAPSLAVVPGAASISLSSLSLTSQIIALTVLAASTDALIRVSASDEPAFNLSTIDEPAFNLTIIDERD